MKRSVEEGSTSNVEMVAGQEAFISGYPSETGVVTVREVRSSSKHKHAVVKVPVPNGLTSMRTRRDVCMSQ